MKHTVAQGPSVCEAGLQESLALFSGASCIHICYPSTRSLLAEVLFNRVGFNLCRLFLKIFSV